MLVKFFVEAVSPLVGDGRDCHHDSTARSGSYRYKANNHGMEPQKGSYRLIIFLKEQGL